AFYNVTYPKLWGIETTDPRAVDAGLEILVAPCMPEHAAKSLAEAFNAKSASDQGAVREALKITRRMIRGELIEHAVIDATSRQSLGEMLDATLSTPAIGAPDA